MKKILFSTLILLSTYSAFAAVQGVSCASIGSGTGGCSACFRETQALYTCNPHQASCQKQAFSGLNDIATNVSGTDKVLYQFDMGTYSKERLQNSTSWTMSHATLGEMFEIPQAYLQPASAAGQKGYQYFSSSGRYGHLLPVGSSVMWTKMKSGAWVRPDIANAGTNKNAPAYKITFTPRLYTDKTNYIDHNQCVFYYVRFCGDGTIDTDRAEQCDDGNMNSDDGCSNTCQTETVTPVCTNLSVSPTSVTNGGSVTYTCTGNNVTSYSIIAKNPDGTTLTSSTSAAGSITIPANTVGDYNISCFVNGQITTPASCQKTVTNTTETAPVCNNLSVSTTSVTNGGNVTYTCSGTNASSYSIQLTNPNNDTIQTFTTATGSLTIPATPTGTYTARCFINGQNSTPSACVKTISNTTVTENPVCNNLTVSRSGTNIDYTCSGSGPISSYTIQRNGNFVSNAQSGTINAGYGTHTIRCLVNTSITSTACEKTITIDRDTPRPEIEVIKDDNDNRDDQQHINIGGVAQFSIRVRNIGTEAIDTVNLTDQLAPECSKSTFEANNIMGKNILYPGESFTYVCHRSNIDQYTFPNNENRICVNGRGIQSGINVNDCDTTRVYFGETQNPACQNIQVSQSGNQVTAVCSPNGGYRLYVLQGNQVVNNFQNPNGQFSFNLNNGNYKIACLRDGERELQAACQRNISVGGTPTNNACIMRSSNRYGGAPLRTELTCESQNYSSCTMRINKDGMPWQTINDCSSPVVFDQRGNYEAICYLDSGENCSTTVQVDIMTVIPTGPFLPTIIILALGGAGYIAYRRRRAA